MQDITLILAGYAAIIILAQLARLAWGIIQQAALWLHIATHRYELEVADRMRRYV